MNSINSRRNTVKIKTELGQLKTLGKGPKFFKCIKKGDVDLFLGLGPEPEIAARLIQNKHAFYIECPMFTDQMPASWRQKIPATFSSVSISRLDQTFLARARVWLYLPGLTFFPGFWTKVLAICRVQAHSQCAVQAQGSGQVFIFGHEHSLLVPDICLGFEELGFRPQLIPPNISGHELVQVLAQTRPEFLLSINFQGIDPLGENLALIERFQIPIAVWCVDNPFHILTRIKGTFWQKLVIFVTDSWFIPHLKKYGGQKVFHLPLATSPTYFYPYEKKLGYLRDKIVFVGRSEFPAKDKFFAASKLEANLFARAQNLALQGTRPDFDWWLKQLNISLWPGNKVRHVGYNAEVLNLYWRKVCLQGLARTDGLVVYGDRNWRNILPANVHLKEEIDYYGPLSHIYTSARYVLNLTSMLLPSGLTQRHFDVWAAGGFLITDYTPGLKLFPQELVSNITFYHPGQIEKVLNELEKQSSLKKDVQSEFYKLILTKHTYKDRLEQILEILDAGKN
ncbi:glycosyltransferase family protein [Desulfovulcanus sp.]